MNLKTFKQFAHDHPAFCEQGLRWLRHKSSENGFGPAFIKVRGRVFIDESRFFEIIKQQQEHGA